MTEWWREPQRIVQTNLRLTDASMDTRQVARDAKKFGATAMFFNVGGIFAWYPSELPLQAINPFLKDDVLGNMLEACRAENIHFIGRFDLSKGTQKAYDAHPEWFCKTKDGRPFEYNGTYQASITGGWYHEQGPALMTEVIKKYDLEAAFFNMFGYQRFNYSHEDFGFSHDESAIKAFAEFSGGKSIPDERDTKSPVYREYLKFQDQTSGIIGRKIYDHIKSLRPGIGVANLAGHKDWIRLEANRSIRRAQPEWQYQTGENARFAQSVGRGEKPYTIGICHFYDFPWRYTAETESFQANRMAQALANGAEPHYYFMGPVETQEDVKPVQAMRDVNAYHARNEALYTGLKSASRIGLYNSKATDRFGQLTIPSDVHGQSSVAYRGAYRSLVESGLAFDLVSDRIGGADDFPAMLKRYDVMVLPDVTCLSDKEAAAFDRYVADGGNLVVTGETGVLNEYGDRRTGNALKSLPIARVREVKRNMFASYLRIGDGEFDFPQTKIIMLDGVYIDAEPKTGAKTMLRVEAPQKFGPPELSFPEVPLTNDPGVIIGAHEKGQVAFVPWSPDKLYQLYSLVEHRQLIAQLVGRFTKPLAKIEKGSRLELTVRKHNKTGQIVVHLINYSGQSNDNFEDPVVQHDLRLGVRGVGGAKAKALWGGAVVDVSAADADGYRWVKVPAIAHMEALVFDAGS
ncbi:MAG TPA: alpha-amylase family protein [Devosiaceae bacterium]|jgi:hypothetical protein